MLKATDTEHAPWYIVRSDDKRKGRLNCIAHMLSYSYKKLKQPKVNSLAGPREAVTTIRPYLDGRNFVRERY